MMVTEEPSPLFLGVGSGERGVADATLVRQARRNASTSGRSCAVSSKPFTKGLLPDAAPSPAGPIAQLASAGGIEVDHSSSVARLPSCMYGAVRSMLRSVGALNDPCRQPAPSRRTSRSRSVSVGSLGIVQPGVVKRRARRRARTRA